MNQRFLIRQAAEDDLVEAKSWYDSRREGLGDEFVLCVEEAFDRIRRMPLMGFEVMPSVRRVGVRRFPFGVFYVVDSDVISIVAVYHGRRNPRGWQARI